MTRRSQIPYALLLALCWGLFSPAVSAQTGPPPSEQRAGTGDVVPAQPAPVTPIETPTSATSTGDSSTAAPQPVITTPTLVPPNPITGNGGVTGGGTASEGEALPEAMRSPRGSVELFLSEAETVLRNREADVQTLLKYMPQKSQNAFDNAGVRDARRIAEVLLELRDRNADFLRLYTLRQTETASIVDWKIDVSSVTGVVIDDRNLPLVVGPKGYWRFTEEAISKASRLHTLLFPDEYFLRQLFEDFGLISMVDTEVLGVGLYQWASLAALIVIAWMLDLLVALASMWIIRRYLKKHEDGRTPGDSAKLVRKAAKPFGLAAAGALLYYALPMLDMPTQAEGILRVAAQIFALFGLFLALSRFIDLVSEYFQRRAIKTSTKFDDLLVPLIRKSAKTILLAFALLTVAESLSLPVTSLIAGFGIAGAAIAFASKDTVENFFGSIAVILDRPFNAGDYVQIDGIEGVVEHLGFRSTRIRTFYNSLITVPNALLVRAKVDNYGMRKYRRYKTTISVLYSTPPDRIEAFVEGLRELVRAHPDTRKDEIQVHFRDFGAHSLDILMWIFFRVPDWTAECAARHQLNMQILRLAARLGVDFAFPTQTLELKRSGVYPQPPTPIDAASARIDGVEAAEAVRSSKVMD